MRIELDLGKAIPKFEIVIAYKPDYPEISGQVVREELGFAVS